MFRTEAGPVESHVTAPKIGLLHPARTAQLFASISNGYRSPIQPLSERYLSAICALSAYGRDEAGVWIAQRGGLHGHWSPRLTEFGTPEVRQFGETDLPECRSCAFLLVLTAIVQALMFSAMNSEPEKKCRACLQSLPVAEFDKSSRPSRDGLQSFCKACMETLRAARSDQQVGQSQPDGHLEAVLSEHGYQWRNHRPRGGLIRVRVLHGPDGRPVDASVALARIEAAIGAPEPCRRPAGPRHICRRSCCTRRHRR